MSYLDQLTEVAEESAYDWTAYTTETGDHPDDFWFEWGDYTLSRSEDWQEINVVTPQNMITFHRPENLSAKQIAQVVDTIVGEL